MNIHMNDKITLSMLLRCGFRLCDNTSSSTWSFANGIPISNVCHLSFIEYMPDIDGEIGRDIFVFKNGKKWYCYENSVKQIKNLGDILAISDKIEYLDYLSFVYLLWSEHGYKIGRTNNIDQRKAFFGVKLPFEVRLLDCMVSRDAPREEAELHREFSEKLLDGEWYRLDREDIEIFWCMERASWDTFFNYPSIT